MSTRIVDRRGGLCEQCDTEYKRLSQHWSRSRDCDYRELSDHQTEILRGCLLGDGSLDGTDHAYVRVGSKNRDHLEWLCDEFGWLARGITLEGDDTYRLRTMAHPAFGRYWTWLSSPSTGYSLTPTAARVWYACDGAVSFGGHSETPQITFAAGNDTKRDALVVLLSQAGFDARAWDRRVAIPRSETERWLDWIGAPTPGKEYKWCTDEAAYREARR